MADFSKEYYELVDACLGYDFSFADCFKELKSGVISDVICEGFGNSGISKEGGTFYIHFRNPERKVVFEDFVNLWMP